MGRDRKIYSVGPNGHRSPGANSTRSEAARGTPEDYAVRMKFAEWLSSAGVGTDRIAIEVLFLLPPAFVREYTRLFHEALNLGEDGKGERDAEQCKVGIVAGNNTPGNGGRGGSRTDSGRVQEIGSLPGGAGTKGRRRGIFAVRNDQRLADKDRVDRSLRKIARGLASGLGEKGEAGEQTPGGSRSETPRCGFKLGKRLHRKYKGNDVMVGCGKYLESEWKYCPWCGCGNNIRVRAVD